MEIATVLIVVHAAAGSLALIAGLGSVLFKKGSEPHKKTGLTFYFSMLLCGLSALIVSCLPQHQNPFLFAVGIFSLYFVLSGKSSLRFKHDRPNLFFDRLLSIVMIITGLLMIFLPILLNHSINIILFVFAITGISFSVKDLIVFKDAQRLREGWLKLHLGKMLGGYISAATAFVVVNDVFPSYFGWFIPGIIGGFFIAYWMKKVTTWNS
jgi:hypothetical protein